MIYFALRRGVRWIDTAAAYGAGRSEEIVGAALRHIPVKERPFVFSKCGHGWDPLTQRIAKVGRETAIRKQVDSSLIRLGVERLDCCYMHCRPEDGTSLQEYWGTLVELRCEGKLRFAGLSNHYASDLSKAEAIGRIDAVQLPYSAINRSIAQAEISWCQTNAVDFIPYGVMGAGLLSGSVSRERAGSLRPSDWRSQSREFHEPLLSHNLRVAHVINRIARTRGVDAAAVSCAWALRTPGVTGVIAGARRTEHVEGWVPALSLELRDDEVQTISDAAEERARHGR